MPIKVTSLSISGLYIIQPKVFGDARGYFFETYSDRDFRDGRINAYFVQDNQSKSSRGVLRGLHFQKKASSGQARAGY